MAYDVTEAFEEIEMSLIKSLRINMQRHIDEEYDEGINWTQWQAEMLAGLSQYRAENADVLKNYMGKINAELDGAIRDAYATGESEQEIALLKAVKRGYKPPKSGRGTSMQGSFFRVNTGKLNALVKATTNDMKKAETALLRMNDDVIRKTMYKAQMFYNTGAGSMWKCVDMATKDFLAAGYNCVEYKNGARVNIASYAEMSLRTSNKRASMMGAAEFREKHGMHLVKVNSRGTACPKCIPFLGRVFVDDVYGKGTKAESKETGYPLLSNAVAKGLFHPNCKDACSTYYEGINKPPQKVTEKQMKETARRYNLEQTQRYYERNYRKYARLASGSIDPENVKKYSAKAIEYKGLLKELTYNNSEILRYDKQRLNLHGVLTVDKNGKMQIKPVIPKPGDIHTQAYNSLIGNIQAIGAKEKFEYKPVERLARGTAEEKIINKLAGGDMTEGSCASLGLAYAGNKAGFDVTDYRGGESQNFFSRNSNLKEFMNLEGVKSTHIEDYNGVKAALSVLKKLEEGKEYFFVAGQHAAVVKNVDGKMQYLELQSRKVNGWKPFTTDTLKDRFGCKKSRSFHGHKFKMGSFAIDISTLNGNDEFTDILGYINTNTGDQKKGEAGHEK